MEEIHKLRMQISSIVQTNFPELDVGFVANLRPPTALQVSLSRSREHLMTTSSDQSSKTVGRRGIH